MPLHAEHILNYKTNNDKNQKNVARKFLSSLYKAGDGEFNLNQLRALRELFPTLDSGQDDARDFLCYGLIENVFLPAWKKPFEFMHTTWTECKDCGYVNDIKFIKIKYNYREAMAAR